MNLSAIRISLVISIFVSIFFLPQSSSAASLQEQQLERAIEFFKKKDYQKALVAFEAAQHAGKPLANIQYNIGVCHYKLGQYAQADKTFKQLRVNKKYRQLTDYNLGLIANRQNHKKTAAYWFRMAMVKKGNKKINRLASIALAKLESKPVAEHKARPWQANVSLALGHDNNVTLSTEQSPSQQSDHYTELFAYGEQQLSSKYTLDGSFHWLNYFDVDIGDFQQARLGLRTNYTYSSWRLTPHLQLAQSRLTDGSFQRQLDIKFSARRRLAKNRSIKLRYRYTDITSLNTSYDYLQGSRQQLRAEFYNRTGLGQLRLRYELEVNDRQNLASANYSPTRHSLRARLKHRLIHAWRVSEELQYRLSDYDSAAGVSRQDDRLRLLLSGDKRIGRDWRLGARYTYTDNNSNLAAETYTRSDIQFYMNYTF